MKLSGWLDTRREDGRTHMDRLIELIGMQGSIRGYGFQVLGGPFGREGLDRDEASELATYGATIEGILIGSDGGPEDEKRFRERVEHGIRERVGAWSDGLEAQSVKGT